MTLCDFVFRFTNIEANCCITSVMKSSFKEQSLVYSFFKKKIKNPINVQIDIAGEILVGKEKRGVVKKV
jgi:hypothetical protein